jgi:hypothetical protein
MTIRNFLCEALLTLNYYLLTKFASINNIMLGEFFACKKLSTACKFACGIRELQAAPIMLAMYR